MEYRVKGLVLTSVDSGENDKLVTILTDSLGKIRFKAKGVKKKNSKYKFAAQPFAFLDCVLIKTGDFYTLKEAVSVHSFFAILEDYDKMAAGFLILEVADKISYFNKQTRLLVPVLKGLENVCYTDFLQSAKAYFLKDILVFTGYTLEFDCCISCGCKVDVSDFMPISLEGGVKCPACIEEGDKRIKKSTYEMTKQVFSSEFPNVTKDLVGVVSLLVKIVETQFSCKLNSI